MAQSGFTPISLYYSATAAAVPSAGDLVAGELALNTNDGKLYFKNSAGVVTLLAGSTSGPAGGSNTQVQYNNSGVLAGITGATSNGTALTLVAPNLGSPSSVGTMPAFTLGGTVSGGGNQINNVIIGTTTPLAGSFTTVSATTTASTAAVTINGTNATGGTFFLVQRSGVAKSYFGSSISISGVGTANDTDIYAVGDGRLFGGDQTTNFTKFTSTGLAVTGTGSFTGDLSVGNAVAATNVGINLLGVASKAKRIVFKTSGAESWLIGMGAASETDAFEIYNGNGNMTLSINKSTSVSTFGAGVAVTGTLSATGTLSGGTSGTGYSFSGSAPATSLTLTSGGNLGVGTSSPASFFSDADNLVVGTTSGNNGISIISGSTGTAALAFGYTTGTSAGDGSNRAKVWYDATSDTLRMSNGGTLMNSTQFVLDGSGNLGLGVTPSAWDSTFKALESGTGSLNGGSFFVQNNGDYTASIATNLYYNAGWKYKNTASSGRYEVYQNTHKWYTAASGTADTAISFTQAMTLDASGNLGIGETASLKRLTVKGSTTDRTVEIIDNGANDAAIMLQLTGVQEFTIGVDRTDSSFRIADGGSLGTNDRLVIDSSGNLLVGATSNSPSTVTGAYIYGGATTAGYWLNNGTTSLGISLALFYSSYSTANETKFEVTSEGNVKSRTNSYAGFSDARLKQGITPANTQWDDIKNIEVVKFQMKSEQFSDAKNPWMLGVIAQQVEQVSPGLVDEDAKDGMKTVKYSILYMKAVKALQEAMTRIEQLEARLDAANL